MIKNEGDWKAKLKKEINRIGVCLSLHGHGMQEPGWPDLWVGTSLWSGWVELKMVDGELSDAQRICGRKLERIEQFAVLRLAADRMTCWREDVQGLRAPRSAPALDAALVVQLLRS